MIPSKFENSHNNTQDSIKNMGQKGTVDLESFSGAYFDESVPVFRFKPPTVSVISSTSPNGLVGGRRRDPSFSPCAGIACHAKRQADTLMRKRLILWFPEVLAPFSRSTGLKGGTALFRNAMHLSVREFGARRPLEKLHVGQTTAPVFGSVVTTRAKAKGATLEDLSCQHPRHQPYRQYKGCRGCQGWSHRS
jgi:hypothetical protein